MTSSTNNQMFSSPVGEFNTDCLPRECSSMKTSTLPGGAPPSLADRGVTLEREMLKYPQLSRQDISNIQAWLRESDLPHMPDMQVAYYLHATFFNIDDAKKAIKYTFQFKKTMREFFDSWDPLSKPFRVLTEKVLMLGLLPRQDVQDPQLILVKVHEGSENHYVFAHVMKWIIMSIHGVLLEDGLQPEFQTLFDSNGYSWAHIVKNPPMQCKHYSEFGDKAAPIRMKTFYFLNTSYFVTNMIRLVKPFLSKKTQECIKFNSNAEQFFKQLPAGTVPVEYGGTGPSLQILHEENVMRLVRHRCSLMRIVE